MKTSLRRIVFVSIAVMVIAVSGQDIWSQSPCTDFGIDAPAPIEGSTAICSKRSSMPLDRQIELVTENQLDQLLGGADPAEIYLSNGEDLERARREDRIGRRAAWSSRGFRAG